MTSFPSKFILFLFKIVLNPKIFDVLSIWSEEVSKKRFYCYNYNGEYEHPTRFDWFAIADEYLLLMQCPDCKSNLTELRGIAKFIRIPLRPLLIIGIWTSLIVYFLRHIF